MWSVARKRGVIGGKPLIPIPSHAKKFKTLEILSVKNQHVKKNLKKRRKNKVTVNHTYWAKYRSGVAPA